MTIDEYMQYKIIDHKQCADAEYRYGDIPQSMNTALEAKRLRDLQYRAAHGYEDALEEVQALLNRDIEGDVFNITFNCKNVSKYDVSERIIAVGEHMRELEYARKEVRSKLAALKEIVKKENTDGGTDMSEMITRSEVLEMLEKSRQAIVETIEMHDSPFCAADDIIDFLYRQIDASISTPAKK